MKVKSNDHTILLVHNDKVISEFILNVLAREGFFIRHVKNWEDTIDQLKQLVPTLILMDHQFIDNQGVEFCSYLRDELQLKEIIVIILTNFLHYHELYISHMLYMFLILHLI